MFDSTVFAFGVFTDSDDIYIVVQRLIAINAPTRSHISVKWKHPIKVTHELNCCHKKWLIKHYFLISRFKERWPFPIGVARGPLSPILFARTDSMAFGGIPNFPSGYLTGVTSTMSHSIGTYCKMGKNNMRTWEADKERDKKLFSYCVLNKERCTYRRRGKDLLDSRGDLRSNTIARNEGHRRVLSEPLGALA